MANMHAVHFDICDRPTRRHWMDPRRDFHGRAVCGYEVPFRASWKPGYWILVKRAPRNVPLCGRCARTTL